MDLTHVNAQSSVFVHVPEGNKHCQERFRFLCARRLPRFN